MVAGCTYRGCGLYPPGALPTRELHFLTGGPYTEVFGVYSHWAHEDGNYCQFGSGKNGGMCLNPKRGRTVLTRSVGKVPNVRVRIITGVLRPETTHRMYPLGGCADCIHRDLRIDTLMVGDATVPTGVVAYLNLPIGVGECTDRSVWACTHREWGL
jgi:hypothetical protein